MAGPAPHLPDSLLFRARSTEYLPRCHQKRCAPNRGVWLLALASAQNCDALTVQLNPMPSVPLQQDYAHSGRDTLQNVVPRLIRAYHSAPSLVRSLPPWSLDKWRSLRNPTRIAPHSTDKRRRVCRATPRDTGGLQNPKTARPPNPITPPPRKPFPPPP